MYTLNTGCIVMCSFYIPGCFMVIYTRLGCTAALYYCCNYNRKKLKHFNIYKYIGGYSSHVYRLENYPEICNKFMLFLKLMSQNMCYMVLKPVNTGVHTWFADLVSAHLLFFFTHLSLDSAQHSIYKYIIFKYLMVHVVVFDHC